MRYVFLTLVVLVLLGLPYKIDIDHRRIRSAKIKDTVKICVLADLHCRRFGDRQSTIQNIVKKYDPDLVMLAGDFFDVDRDPNAVYELVKALKNYQILYVTGNHEGYMGKEAVPYIEQLKRMGVLVLKDESILFEKGNTSIEIVGIDDITPEKQSSAESISKLFYNSCFRILLTHRPNWTETYKNVECDLIITGHTHGGQFRLPFTHIGLISPTGGNQSKMTEGLHKVGNAVMYVSRGLATGVPGVPRLYNNPEIGCITLKPDHM